MKGEIVEEDVDADEEGDKSVTGLIFCLSCRESVRSRSARLISIGGGRIDCFLGGMASTGGAGVNTLIKVCIFVLSSVQKS